MVYGKAVKYTENGKLFEAIVFQEHFGLESHLGANDEPLVHVLIADPAKEHLNLADPMQKMIVRHDVAHASHEFTEEELADYERRGIDAAKQLSNARWHESRDPREVVAELAKAAEDRKLQAKAEAENKQLKVEEVKNTEPPAGGGQGSIQ
jgi:hypothetical protein